MGILKIRWLKRNLPFIALFSCLTAYLILSIFLGRTGDVSSLHNSDSNLFLIIIILSSPENFAQRQKIRDSWINLISKNHLTKHVFIIGNQTLSSNIHSKILEENIKNGDIVFVPIKDSYRELTSKVLHSFHYINKNYKFQYLLKCDDDTFVNFRRFYVELNKLSHPLLYWGYFSGQAHVFSKGIWRETNWYLCDRYLPYALGGGYVLAHKLVSFISTNYQMLRKYSSEDVSVGTWLASVKVRRIHDIRFDTQATGRSCQKHHIVKHKMSSEAMEEAYKNIIQSNDNDFPCPVLQSPFQVKSLRPYSYNWSVLPSQCCRYVDPSDNRTPVLYPARLSDEDEL